MKGLVLNSLDSSIEFTLFSGEMIAAEGAATGIGKKVSALQLTWTDGAQMERSHRSDASIRHHLQGLENIVAALESAGLMKREELKVIGHRCGDRAEGFSAPIVVNDEKLEEIRGFRRGARRPGLAHLEGLEAARGFLPDVPSVAAFETEALEIYRQSASAIGAFASPVARYRKRAGALDLLELPLNGLSGADGPALEVWRPETSLADPSRRARLRRL